MYPYDPEICPTCEYRHVLDVMCSTVLNAIKGAHIAEKTTRNPQCRDCGFKHNGFTKCAEWAVVQYNLDLYQHTIDRQKRLLEETYGAAILEAQKRAEAMHRLEASLARMR